MLLALFVVQAVFVFLLEAIVLDLTWREAETGRQQSLLVLPVVLVVIVAWASLLLERVYPLLREEPSLPAYRAALALPPSFLRGALIIVCVASGFDLAMQLRRGRVAPSLAIGMDLLAVAESATILVVAYVLLRRAVRPVLARVPPARAMVRRTERLRNKLAAALAVLTGTFAVAMAIVVSRALDGSLVREARVATAHDLAVLGAVPATLVAPLTLGSVLPWALALAAIVLSALIGARFAASVGRDLGTATGAIDQLAGDEIDRSSSRPPEPSTMRFVEIRELGRAITELADRFAELSHMNDRSIQARAEAQRMKTQFLASMSHDLRSPLNSIIGFSELLLRGIEGPLTPAQKEVLRIIHGSGEDLLRLINDILDSAKLEAGRLDVQREWTPSVEILNETIKRSREFVGDKDIDLIAELQPGLPPVFVDADRLSQALLNVIANAFKFMEQGTVSVRATIGEADPGLGGRYLRVEIADTGTGIREEDRETIFEAFRQIDGSSSRRAGGMGLGLSLARAIVELHGGKVWVESRLGTGSVFTIAIPIGE